MMSIGESSVAFVFARLSTKIDDPTSPRALPSTGEGIKDNARGLAYDPRSARAVALVERSRREFAGWVERSEPAASLAGQMMLRRDASLAAEGEVRWLQVSTAKSC